MKKNPNVDQINNLFVLQFTARDIHQSITENNGKSHSPNVINIDLDSDRSRTQVKSITLGELTDSIIAKDFSPHPFIPLRQPFMPYHQDSIVTTDQWKYNRRMQQQKEEQQQQQHHQQQSQQQQSQQQQQQQQPSNKNQSGRSSVPDERQIIRMAQPPSPRNKQFHESASPPDGHFYQIAAPTMQSINRAVQPPPQSPHHPFALHCYVKNRIVEAMRTEDEKRADETNAHERRITPQSHHKDNDRSSTPCEMIIDEDVLTVPSSSASSSIDHHNIQYSQPPVTSFAPTATYTYPFVSSGAGSVQLSQSMPPSSQHLDDQKRNQHNSQQEPKPLLLAQYEALSDED